MVLGQKPCGIFLLDLIRSLLQQVLEKYSFEDIGEVSTAKHSGLHLVTHQGERIVLTTEKAAQIKELINSYIVESNGGAYDYVRALADFTSRDENMLKFRKGEIIAVVPKHDAYTEKGWLYGVKEGHYGLFPSDFVERLSPQAVRREMKVIAKVTAASARAKGNSEESDDDVSDDSFDEEDFGRPDDEDLIDDHHVRASAAVRGQQQQHRIDPPDYSGREDDSWDANKARSPHDLRDDLSEASAGAAERMAKGNDGKHPLLEFAISYFRERDKFEIVLQGPDDEQQGGDQKGKKKKQKKKSKGGKSEEWTWKDQVELVKWTDRMISNSLLRLEPSDVNKIALECFACVMRYMGDLPLLKNQHEVDCVNTILMYCHKFEAIRNEVYCQMMKQTTNNKSAVRDSCQKGWRLMSIVAAYFSCSELLRPFLFKYLESAAYDRRRAYHGTALVCLHNLRKTFKYGGRKNVPSIEEITAISAGRSSKRQIYR